MASIHFEPVSDLTFGRYVQITRETLWHPVWPGEQAIVRDFYRALPEIQAGTWLIYDGRELVGRVVTLCMFDVFVIRDLGLRPRAGLSARVAAALLEQVAQRAARVVRALVFAPYWPALAAGGLGEQKRRITMALDLNRVLQPTGACAARGTGEQDQFALAELFYAAYHGTVDDEGEDVAAWFDHLGHVLSGRFGTFLPEASFVTPVREPFASTSLLIECAPASAILAHVATHRAHVNRGYARALIGRSLSALAAHGFRRCFLEVTTTNANAFHLYRSLDFNPIGPEIVYGNMVVRA